MAVESGQLSSGAISDFFWSASQSLSFPFVDGVLDISCVGLVIALVFCAYRWQGETHLSCCFIFSFLFHLRCGVILWGSFRWLCGACFIRWLEFLVVGAFPHH